MKEKSLRNNQITLSMSIQFKKILLTLRFLLLLDGIAITFLLLRTNHYKPIKLRFLNTKEFYRLSLDMLQDHLQYNLLQLNSKIRFLKQVLLQNQNGWQRFHKKIHIQQALHYFIPQLLQKIRKNPGYLHFHLWKLNTLYLHIKV